MNKPQLMKRALSTLAASARVRWLQKEAQLHNLLEKRREKRRQLQVGDTLRLANIAMSQPENCVCSWSEELRSKPRQHSRSIPAAGCNGCANTGLDRKNRSAGASPDLPLRRNTAAAFICIVATAFLVHIIKQESYTAFQIGSLGTHDGNITKAVDAMITERFLLAKIGSASNRVAVAGAADTPIGVITDEAAAIGDFVNVALLGARPSTVRIVASGAISQGALLEPAANGRVQTLGAGAGTHHVVGRALDAATAAGDVIEVDPLYFLRVI